MNTSGNCQRCGGALALAGRGPIPKFCSTRCRVAAHRAKRPPVELTSRDRWVRWLYVSRGKSKPTKLPIRLTGAPASSAKSSTWTSYAKASKSTRGDGLGFVLGDGIGCIDLDHCIVDGRLEPWAQRIVDSAPATFIEVSPSGDGLHIFGRLTPGPGRGQRGKDGIEVYSHGRYITITGIPWPGSTNTLGDLTEVAESL